MLNEVKHLGREREVSIATEGTCDGQILRSAQDDNHHMTSHGALDEDPFGLGRDLRGAAGSSPTARISLTAKK